MGLSLPHTEGLKRNQPPWRFPWAQTPTCFTVKMLIFSQVSLLVSPFLFHGFSINDHPQSFLSRDMIFDRNIYPFKSSCLARPQIYDFRSKFSKTLKPIIYFFPMNLMGTT